MYIGSFFNFCNQINPDLFTLLSVFVIIGMLLFSFKVAQVEGLYIYITVALIACNIQVLKGTNFFFSKEPIPLGTLTYGTISIGVAIISEFFGLDKAKKTVLLGFMASVIFTIFMIITIGYRPLLASCINDETKFLLDNHQHILALFSPMPVIFISSLVAYLTSEYSTAFLQHYFKKLFKERFLSIRTYIANTIGALIDLVVMNFLAWMILNPNPLGAKQILISYILAAYPFRLLSGILSIPTIKIAKYLIKK